MYFLNSCRRNKLDSIAGRNISDNIIIVQEVIHSMRAKKKGNKWMTIKLDLEKAYDRVSWDFVGVFRFSYINDFEGYIIVDYADSLKWCTFSAIQAFSWN